jgi:hypothetical protein
MIEDEKEINMFESNGTKRAAGILFFVLGAAFENVPNLQPYRWILDTLGVVFGVSGVAHASIAKKK